MLCIHHNDLDGRAAAAVVFKWYRDQTKNANTEDTAPLRFVEINYNDQAVPECHFGERVFIVDFHFKPEVISEMASRAGRILQIDHHKTTPKLYEAYLPPPNVTLIHDQSASGALLAWKYLFPDFEIPRVIELVDDYDRWVFKHSGITRDFQAGMTTIWDNRPESSIWSELFSDDDPPLLAEICQEGFLVGKVKAQQNEAFCNGMGFETELDGHKAFAVNAWGNSTTFGTRLSEYPIGILFTFNGKKWTVSLYSETVDVSEICRARGGGGHKGAAGFTCDTLPFK